jgi:hypothetical protein
MPSHRTRGRGRGSGGEEVRPAPPPLLAPSAGSAGLPPVLHGLRLPGGSGGRQGSGRWGDWEEDSGEGSETLREAARQEVMRASCPFRVCARGLFFSFSYDFRKKKLYMNFGKYFGESFDDF